MQLPAPEFREAMSRFASGVTIVTTVAPDGTPRGYTASAFCSLSVQPPMVLSCLSGQADSHPVFVASERFAVSILRPRHRELALRFASRGGDKFDGAGFVPGASGLPVLPDALAVVECRLDAALPGGDHTILTGVVEHARAAEGGALLHFRREFWQLGRAHEPAPLDLP